jgi:hypothetical protein
MDFTNFTTVPEWVQVLTKAKLPGHDNQSTQPPQWFALGAEGAKGKTCDVAVRPLGTALPLAFALAWPHTHTHVDRGNVCSVQTVSVVYVFCMLRRDLRALSRTSGAGFSCKGHLIEVWLSYVCV